jgi:hypothetical protein
MVLCFVTSVNPLWFSLAAFRLNTSPAKTNKRPKYYVGPLLTSPEAGEARSGRSTEPVLRPVSTHRTTVPATVRSTSHAWIRPLSVHQKLRIVSATA